MAGPPRTDSFILRQGFSPVQSASFPMQMLSALLLQPPGWSLLVSWLNVGGDYTSHCWLQKSYGPSHRVKPWWREVLTL